MNFPIIPNYPGHLFDIVKAIALISEAHPMALYSQLMTSFGSAVGIGPHFIVEADLHGTNLFVLNVGDSAKGRKGTSWGHVEALMKEVDPIWFSKNIKSGLGSGEGLIWTLRDSSELDSSGPNDQPKNILLMESEFGGLLQVVNRDGNTISANLRNAWDRKPISNITKGANLKASEHHVSVIGHITKTELQQKLRTVEVMNGLGNRFLYFAVKRTKFLPDGGSLDPRDKMMMINELKASLLFARNCRAVNKDTKAQEYWRDLYMNLAEGEVGVVGVLSSRAEAQIMRMALIHALVARRSFITDEDLQTAAAIHQYSVDSLKYLFGEKTGFPLADNILEFLKLNPGGVTRTQIHDKFNRNLSKDNLANALAVLLDSCLLRTELRNNFGKTIEIYLPVNTTFLGVSSEVNEFNEQRPSFSSYCGGVND